MSSLPSMDSNGEHQELIVLPSLIALPDGEGRLILTEKYLSGMAAYAATWPGNVTSLVRVEDKTSTEMDLVSVALRETEPTVEIRPTEPSALRERLAHAAVVFAGLTGDELELAQICHRDAIPLVLNSEYTLHTQEQIVRANTDNLILRWRRLHWTRQYHKRAMQALSLATSLQCSGTPTFYEYRNRIADPLLFFDNRVSASDVIATQEFRAKLDSLSQDRPLRIVFGGRFVPMKGVLELPEIADHLRTLGVSFEFDIVGSGPLENQLQSRLAELDLATQVRVRPAMDFKTGWIPFLRSEADLFVCAHLQGDPSSTYPEVMSCGVPIVGYENEALKGLQQLSHAVVVSESRPASLALKVHEIARSDRMAELANAARSFALRHTFESTFLSRVEHMVRCSRLDSEKKNQWREKYLS